jgi:protein-S-isoprenylcysteine O-methyltransferase Ste14
VAERVQGRGGAARDRGTRVVIALTLGLAIGLAGMAESRGTGPRIPGSLRAAGVVVMLAGLALRVWAIATLGRAFRTTVEVDQGQAVVATGPYRWVRHPSYGGLLLIAIGFGAGSGSWLGLAACALLPVPGLLWRIRVEEAELGAVLGDDYRAYQARTRRLIPGVW